AFGLLDRRRPKNLSGPTVSRGNGLPGVSILSIWLSFPQSAGPFLEIMEYSEWPERPWPAVNQPGYGHIALAVPNVRATIDHVLRSGGALQGSPTNFGSDERPHWIVYMRDPEGKFLELEQPALH
ncbi:MAG: glyoxalase/bleomycin resistance/dioxygenase family protein, partial [Pseudomonadota bacterium]